LRTMERKVKLRNRTITFSLWLAIIAAILGRTLARIFEQSLHAEYSSHIVLMPFILAYLVWSGREKIFAKLCWAWSKAAIPFAFAIAGLIGIRFAPGIPADLVPTLYVLSALILVIAGFLACFGPAALNAALFPVLMMLLLVPLPDAVINKLISSLQIGSAQLSSAIFSLMGVPVYRDGVVLTLPGVTIEVAKECSGINSTVALLITMLLAAHETLQRKTSRFAFILISIPLSVVKNAIRIVTLVLLATYVDPGFLTGRLHHQGGFVFFGIALALMYPVWKLLKATERRSQSTSTQDEITQFKASAVGR
jgi:exosortase